MMKLAKKRVIIGSVSGFCIAILILSIGLYVFAFNPGWYERAFARHGAVQASRIDEADLPLVTQALIDYMQGRREELIVYANIDGTYQEVFNEREKLHMVDVKNIFAGVFFLTGAAVVIGAVCIFTIFRFFDSLLFYRTLLWTGALTLGILALIAGFAILNFSLAFDIFHLIFFRNDLWLLNPRTDRLIQIMPQPFFEDIARNWLTVVVIGYFACLVSGITGIVMTNRRENLVTPSQ